MILMSFSTPQNSQGNAAGKMFLVHRRCWRTTENIENYFPVIIAQTIVGLN